MAGTKGKGGKNRRRGRNDMGEKRELLIKEDLQEYGQVVKMLGNGRLLVFCVDGQQRLGHIRGKMRKRVWINAGDVILLSLRTFQDEKADVVHKYNPDEVRALKVMKEVPENFKIPEADLAGMEQVEDDEIGFADESDEIDIDNV